MDNLHSWFTRNGILTFKTQYTVDLPSAAKAQVQLTGNIPTNIGFLFGISVLCGGTAPDAASTLPTIVQCRQLYLTLKLGTEDQYENLRLDNLVMIDPTAAPTWKDSKQYFPITGPDKYDMKKSYVSNPASLTSIALIFDLWYITYTSYEYCLENNILKPMVPSGSGAKKKKD